MRSINLQSATEAAVALKDVVVTEEMIVRIVDDQDASDIQPRVVGLIKEIINVIASVANPSDVYGNLIQGGLEAHAVEALRSLEVKIKAHHAYMDEYLTMSAAKEEKRQLNNQLHRVRDELTALREDEVQRAVVLEQIANERDEWKAQGSNESYERVCHYYDEKKAQLRELCQKINRLESEERSLLDKL